MHKGVLQLSKCFIIIITISIKEHSDVQVNKLIIATANFYWTFTIY